MFDRAAEFVLSRHLRVCLFLACLVAALCLPGLGGLFPMDRDEPRFAQSSKQMLETGDFVAIRFQDKARNKKPAGIYWMQAAAVATGERLGVPEARTAIWLYRLPSLFGALASVLLTYWSGLAFMSRRGAATAATLFAATLLLVAEAHLAKTDAVLCATVVATMGVLGRAWHQRADDRPLGVGLCTVFWTANAVGVLVKGPITPLVPLVTAITLVAVSREARWLTKLRPGWGSLGGLLLVLPWFALTIAASGMAFFNDAIGQDMAAKVVQARELHGAPPGSYLAAFWLTGWPMAPFLLTAAPFAWRMRRSDGVVFLLAWLVPLWVMFEVLPTKLPHYVLPLYPAVALLIGRAAEPETARPSARAITGVVALLLVVPCLLPGGLSFATGRLTSHVTFDTIGLAAAASGFAFVACLAAARWRYFGRAPMAALAAAVAAVALYGFTFGWFLNASRADLIALSPRLANAASAALGPGCRRGKFASVGDNEPSLVFLTATDLLVTDAAGAAAFLNGGACRAAFVVRPEEKTFARALGRSPARLAALLQGVNINTGKKLDIAVYVRQEDAR